MISSSNEDLDMAYTYPKGKALGTHERNKPSPGRRELNSEKGNVPTHKTPEHIPIIIHQSSQQSSLGQMWRNINQWSRYKVQEIYSGVRAYGTERADIRVISGRLDTQQMSIRTREQPSVVGSIASFRLQASFRRVCNHCVVVVTDNQCCEFT